MSVVTKTQAEPPPLRKPPRIRVRLRSQSQGDHTRSHTTVERYGTPDEFAEFAHTAGAKGFRLVSRPSGRAPRRLHGG